MIEEEIYFANLKASRLGMPLINADTVDSTNKLLLDKATQGLKEGALAVAETQTAGRGRHNRTWHSPSGLNLYFSLLLWPKVPTTRFPQLAMISAMALRNAILEEIPELNVKLKWPNDLWLDERKLSGILCECTPEEVEGRRGIVLGIGLNVNSQMNDFPQELHNIATSLRWKTGQETSRERLLAIFCNQFQEIYDRWQDSESLATFLPEWRKYDALADRIITVDTPTGKLTCPVMGYTDTGIMLLKTNDGVKSISAGDVHVSREEGGERRG